MNKIPGLALRLPKDAEMLGTDQAEHGEGELALDLNWYPANSLADLRFVSADAYEYVSSLSQTQEWGYSGSATTDKKEAAALAAPPTEVVAETPVAATV